MNTPDQDKLKKLIEKKQHLENRIKLEQNRIAKKERRIDTRKKILAGAYILEEYKDKMPELIKKLDKFLTRPLDRQLFGLAPITLSNDSQESL
jgi:hypothetical protein